MAQPAQPAPTRLASRIAAMEPSPTVSIDGRAKELRQQGVDIVNFSAGEPDFPTPDNVKEAAKRAIDANQTRYTPVAGTPELRAAVAAKLRRQNGLNYEPSEIMISNGGKQALYCAFMALCEPGDEAIIIAPYWVTYPEQARLAGATPVFARADATRGFHIGREQIEALITPRTRVLVVNSPSNPSGAVLTREELQGIAELAQERDLWVISDEIYEHLVYDGREHVSLASFPGMKERTVLINGLSKAYAMTGWRMGYAAAPKAVIEAMVALQGHVSHGPSSISQAAAVEALNGPQDSVAAMVAAYDERRKQIVERLNQLPEVRCAEPEGAFYVFADFSAWIGERTGLATDIELAAYLLEEAKVALVPGTGFGWPGYLRLSYATSLEQIHEGMDRIARALGKLRN
ncbi:MAG TPA: pyridoxal phosphate-dependent aminotransferase [Bacillota bacterium]